MEDIFPDTTTICDIKMPVISVSEKVTGIANSVADILKGRKSLTSVFLSNQGHRS